MIDDAFEAVFVHQIERPVTAKHGSSLDFGPLTVHMQAKPPWCGHWRAGRVKGFSVRLPGALRIRI